MRFAVETWDPGYGSSAGPGVRASELETTSRDVDIAVERPPDRWEPLVTDFGPSGDGEPESVTFVDGVRRIDARIWIEQHDAVARPGVCASVAAGAVCCRRDRAVITEVVVARGIYTAAHGADAIADAGGLGADYEVRLVADDTDEALYFGVHTHMAELETELSRRLSTTTTTTIGGGDPVVFDGPLGDRDHASAVGYVKTQHVHYLPEELRPTVGALAVGHRTPLFFVAGRSPIWSWYLRLPGPIGHSMSGVVRLELPGLGPVESAAGRADEISNLLGRFASAPHKDARAPQNLYPIAGLERELRRRLGDARLLERALRRSAA
jgi:hypothetical protein